MDARRAFFSWGFLISIVGILLTYLIGLNDQWGFMKDAFYGFDIMHVKSPRMLLLVLGALPYAMSFCSDWRNQYIRPSAIRTSPGKYAASKITACSLSAFCAVFIAELVLVLVLLTQHPLVDAGKSSLQGYQMGPFADVIASGQYFLFVLIQICIEGFLCALFAVAALWVSVYIPNIFVVLASPVLMYYFLINFIGNVLRLPGLMQINYIYNGNCKVGGSLTSFLYPLGVTIALCALLGALFVKGVKRRLSDG